MVVFHIDLNAFFASAEMVKDPTLIGKPVVVGGKSRKGVVCTASYEARNFGVRSAMPIFEARKLCPELIVVEGDYSLYESLSSKFIQHVKSYTPLVEQASIDECYADMSAVIGRYERPLDLAVELQATLQQTLKLDCSIGIGPNKFLAKIASDMRKPLGITVLRKKEVPTKLWPLPIEAIGGIGRKTAPTLKQHGIITIGDMAAEQNRELIHTVLGNMAHTYLQYAHGEDDSELVRNQTMTSMSQSTTLDQDITDYDTIRTVFSGLARSLERRLHKEQLAGDSISISIRYYNFETITRSKKMPGLVQSYDDLFAVAMMLFDAHDKELPIRHLGIALHNLKQSLFSQEYTLFTQSQDPVNSVDQVITQLNEMLKQNAIKKLSDLVVSEQSFHGIYRK